MGHTWNGVELVTIDNTKSMITSPIVIAMQIHGRTL